MKILLYFIFLFTIISNCTAQQGIEGLWVVQSVLVGEEEMTPNARWTRFNADFTQQSGNGWLQHSYGSWSLDSATDELSVINTNGLNDPNGPFKVSIQSDKMEWKRTEEGQEVTVLLTKANQLPPTFADQLLGLWELEATTGNSSYFPSSEDESAKVVLLFRWDRRFMTSSKEGRINGVYNVHGHKAEVEFIPYGEQHKRTFWAIKYGENTITLSLLNSDTPVSRTFKRIHEFPQN